MVHQNISVNCDKGNRWKAKREKVFITALYV